MTVGLRKSLVQLIWWCSEPICLQVTTSFQIHGEGIERTVVLAIHGHRHQVACGWQWGNFTLNLLCASMVSAMLSEQSRPVP